MADAANGRNLDPGIRLILAEIRDLRREGRDDRREAAADRRQADADRRQADADRRQADAERRQADADRRRSDERFHATLREFREESARRAAETQRMFRDIRAVGLSIVKTLNHHTRILERIERKLGGRHDGRPDNGRSA